VAAAAPAHRDAAVIVAAAGMLALGQRLDRLALPQLAAVDDDQLALARRRRLVCLECHGDPCAPYRPVVTSMRMALGERHDRLLDVALPADAPAERLVLPLRTSVLTALTLTSNSFSTASLICGLVASSAHLEDDLVCSERRRFLGDHRAIRMIVVVARVSVALVLI
jgi:hypothetical protein